MEGLWKEKKIKELSFLRFGRNIPRKVFEKGPYRIKAMKIDIFTVSVIVHNKKKIRRFKNELTRSFNLNPFSNKYINNCGILDLWGPFRRFLH